MVSLLGIAVACVALDLWERTSRTFRDEELVELVDGMLVVSAVLDVAC